MKTEEKIPGGLGKVLHGSMKQQHKQIATMHGIDVSEVDSEVSKGIEVEMEHTTDKDIAHEIAMDHVIEDPEYYTKLSKTELEERKKKRKKRKKAGTESSKENNLRDWFKRKGAKGKKGGWVDCNSPDGKGGYKACGREKGEKRKKYPACRPTPGACKERGKGKSWGKKAKRNETMKITNEEIKKIILEEIQNVLKELDISELDNICYSGSKSSHELMTCTYGGNSFFLKFSDSFGFRAQTDRTLQTAVEYLSYRIYSLYPDVKIPQEIHIISDPNKKRIGLATKSISGKSGRSVDASTWVNSISSGIMVDILLANWDIANTSNFVIDDNGNGYRIDPGGTLTFRAQGGRKYDRFSQRAGELETMLDPNMRGGAGWLLSMGDMIKASTSFLSVSWNIIGQTIEMVKQEAIKEMQNAGLTEEIQLWISECEEISVKLKTRHQEISEHCNFVLETIEK